MEALSPCAQPDAVDATLAPRSLAAGRGQGFLAVCLSPHLPDLPPFVTDGAFGRCQELPAVDVHHYEVSPGVLQHLTATLRALSRTGLTWQDGYTQHVMARELASLPQTSPRRPEASGAARSSKQSVQDKRSLSLEGDVLAEALQRYLPYLEALSQAAVPDVLPGLKPDRPPAQGEDPPADSVLTFVSRTSALTYAPTSRFDFPGDRPLRTLRRLQPDELSPKVAGGADRQSLVAALGAYAARKPPAPPRDGDPAPRKLVRTPWREPRVLSAPAAPQKWPSPPDPRDAVGTDDGARDVTSVSSVRQEAFRAAATFCEGDAASLCLVSVQQPRPRARVQALLKDLRERPGSVEGLSALDVADAARAIANAMPGGRAEGEQDGAGRGGGGPRGQAGRSGAARHRDGVPDNRVRDSGAGFYQEVSRLGVKLGDLLQGPGSPFLPGAPRPAGSFKTEIKKSEDPEASPSSEEDRVGVENIKSQTYSKELLQRPPHPEPGPGGLGASQLQAPAALQEDQRSGAGARGPPGQGLRLEVQLPQEEYGYIVTENDPLSPEKGTEVLEDVARLLDVPAGVFSDIAVSGPAVTFRVRANPQNVTAADAAKVAADSKDQLEKMSGLRVLQTGVGSKSKPKLLPHQAEREDSTKFIVLTLVSIVAIVAVLLASGVIYCLRHSSQYRLKEKLSGPGGDPDPDATNAYQELCRQRMAARPSERPETAHTSRVSSVSSQFSDGPIPSPSARGSTSSWSEEPVQPNMDISTGHMVLAYMEDHLKNKNRLEKEWEALCAYQAEPDSSLVAQRGENVPKNRCPAVLTYDHSRIRLKSENSHSSSDYINASPIMDHDPRKPAYIATQGPLPATVADFWQMVWESGCVVIVMLTPLSENGVRQCYHYWPDEGSNLYHVYEVHLVSEHIWCEDFLVRSFYLKNLQTNETRTVTQFHFLSWYDKGVPASTRSLLDFRRKVNKCYRGRSCPIIVHCSDGAGRSGTYILIDMVLNKMAKGAKELDIAATLEHLRDQRPRMVQTKEQFEFALTAVAEEVNAILKAFPQ
ncbi:PREDICTED: receptor-type tyrosine-protein phosphatase N2 [Lipotes vexillifer]|uniref:Receptor-type tyrosine-protein phosphatase N2 n=1 Tax=Lipotes vexillifer TaxID=118797 RepID=A0A340XRV7_LIPVE|nr:PREDICTED: receptor-type tyrosine-protein phosphatase N2 [Lipotes vexillifer]